MQSFLLNRLKEFCNNQYNQFVQVPLIDFDAFVELEDSDAQLLQGYINSLFFRNLIQRHKSQKKSLDLRG